MPAGVLVVVSNQPDPYSIYVESTLAPGVGFDVSVVVEGVDRNTRCDVAEDTFVEGPRNGASDQRQGGLGFQAVLTGSGTLGLICYNSVSRDCCPQ